jgi:serine/threonine protein kinase
MVMKGTDAAPLDGRLVVGRYRLGRMLGRGGMGTVWAAQDEVLGRPVALKEVLLSADLAPEQRERVRRRTMREARAAARINHPNAVTVYDVVEDEGRPWIVMQLLEAESLADTLARRGPLPVAVATGIGVDLVDALRAAERAGVLHRDVKPGNVMLLPNGSAVLTDFGIAVVADDPTLTTTGLLIGSAEYMSPERARGEQPTAASDLWSLGATLFTAIEGHSPFRRDGQLPTLHAVVSDPAPPAVHAGPLTEVIARLLAKDPAERPDAARARVMLLAARAEAAQQNVENAPTEPYVRARVDLDPFAVWKPPSPAARLPGPMPVPPLPAAAQAPPPAPARAPAPQPAPEPGTDDETTPVETLRRGRRSSQPPPGPSPEALRPTTPVPVKPAVAAPPSAPQPSRSPGPAGRRRRVPIAVGAAIVVLTAVIGLIALNRPADPDRNDQDKASSARSSATGAAAGPSAAASSRPAATTPRATTSPTPAATTGPTSAETGGVPAGFRSHRDPTGFQVAVPRGWTRSVRGTSVYFRAPSGGSYLQVDTTTKPKADALKDWKKQETAVARRLPGYHRLRLERVRYRGWNAADWEFTWRPAGGSVHVLNRNIRVDDHRAYALYWSVPVSQWASRRSAFDTIAGSFEPA